MLFGFLVNSRVDGALGYTQNVSNLFNGGNMGCYLPGQVSGHFVSSINGFYFRAAPCAFPKLGNTGRFWPSFFLYRAF